MPKSIGLVFGLLFVCFGQQQVFWAPKPTAPTKYVPPHKPHTRLADLKAKYKGQANWRELVVDDDYLRAEYIFSAPGTKVPRRLHSDTREWWAVMEGEIRFDIQGQQPLVARRGSIVQVPMQTIYSMETLGGKPSLRLEVNIARARTLYPKDVTPPASPGLIDWLPVTILRWQPAPYDRGNLPHVNVHELAEKQANQGKNFLYPAVQDDRGFANVIYGWEKNLPPLNPKERGHYHPETSEFWLVMTGQIRYPIERMEPFVAEEGDIVYVPIFTFHYPRFHGPAPSCRLAMNGYPNIGHLYDAPDR